MEQHNNIIFYLIVAIATGVVLMVTPCTWSLFDIGKICYIYILVSVIVIICSIKVLQGNKINAFGNTKRINIALILYLIASIISVVFSISSTISFFGVYKRFDGLLSLIVYIALFIISANFVTRKNVSILLNAIIGTAIICCIVGSLQTDGVCYMGGDVTSIESIDRIIRPYSTFGNPVFFSLFLVMVLPFVYLKIFEYKDIKIRTIYFLALLFISLSLVTTQTRAGIIACTVSGIVFFVFSKRVKIVTIISVFFILLFILILSGQKRESTWWRFMNPEYYKGRIEICENSIPIIKENLVTGIGLDCLGLKLKITTGVRNRAHNEFLQHLLCAGILGLLAYIYLVGRFAKDIWRFYKDEEDKLLLTTLFASCLAYFVFIQFNPGHIEVTCLFWILSGSIYGIKSSSRNNNILIN